MAELCTWVDCKEIATHPQIAQDGERWANLCISHNEHLDQAIKSLDPKRILSVWIKAQGREII